MNEPIDQSVTMWIAALKEGDQDAAHDIWDRFFERLVRVARNKLGSSSRRVADEEDVAISAFDSLCRGAAAGRFTELTDRDDLWKLLVRISAQKSVDQMRHQGRQKRGGGAVRGHSIFARRGDKGPADFDAIMSEEPTPHLMAMLDEENARLLDQLRDDVLRRIALLRLSGHTNEEIAEETGISLRSVERKLGVIRAAWARELEG